MELFENAFLDYLPFPLAFPLDESTSTSEPLDPMHVPKEVRKKLFPTPSHRCSALGCGRAYTWICDLKKHIKNEHPLLYTHQPKITKQGRSFPCPRPECPHGFGERHNLVQHWNKVHPDAPPLEAPLVHVKMFQCPHAKCRSRFSRKSSLEKHLKRTLSSCPRE